MNDEAVACANEARPSTPALPPPHEIVKHNPPAMPPPCEDDKLVAAPHPLSPDMARVEEDRLEAEAVELERLVRFNLVESAARLLDGDLAPRGRPVRKDRRSHPVDRPHAARLRGDRADCCRPPSRGLRAGPG